MLQAYFFGCILKENMITFAFSSIFGFFLFSFKIFFISFLFFSKKTEPRGKHILAVPRLVWRNPSKTGILHLGMLADKNLPFKRSKWEKAALGKHFEKDDNLANEIIIIKKI